MPSGEETDRANSTAHSACMRGISHHRGLVLIVRVTVDHSSSLLGHCLPLFFTVRVTVNNNNNNNNNMTTYKAP